MTVKIHTGINGTRAICDCCPRPFAVRLGNVWVIEADHGGRTHPKMLTVEDLREMADLAEAERKVKKSA